MSVYPDRLVTKIGVKAATTDHIVGMDGVPVKIGGKPSGANQLLGAASMPGKAGVKPSLGDTKSASETLGAKIGAKETENSAWVTSDALRTKIGAKVGATADALLARDPLGTKVGGKESLAEQLLGAESPTARAGGKPSGPTVLTAAESPTAKIGAKESLTEKLLVLEILPAKIGGKGALSELRVLSDALAARVGAKAAATEQLAGIDTAAAKIGLTPSQRSCVHFTTDALIPALRRKARGVLTELAAAPEALSTAVLGDDLAFPLLVIAALDPRPDTDTATFSYAQWVPVDFVYVAEIAGDGVTDTVQAVRQHLDRFADSLVDDYHLGGIVHMTEFTATPMARANQYQQIFSDEAQNLVVQVLTVEFRVVSDVLCG